MLHSLDARDLLCPMPVIKVQNKVKNLNDEDELEVFCTDPGVVHDIPAWCRVHGHKVLSVEEDGDVITIRIRVAKA